MTMRSGAARRRKELLLVGCMLATTFSSGCGLLSALTGAQTPAPAATQGTLNLPGTPPPSGTQVRQTAERREEEERREGDPLPETVTEEPAEAPDLSDFFAQQRAAAEQCESRSGMVYDADEGCIREEDAYVPGGTFGPASEEIQDSICLENCEIPDFSNPIG